MNTIPQSLNFHLGNIVLNFKICGPNILFPIIVKLLLIVVKSCRARAMLLVHNMLMSCIALPPIQEL